MASDVAALIAAGLALDLDERAVLANSLLNSLHRDSDVGPGTVDAAWSEEISSRVDDILENRGQLIDADEHYARLRATLAPRNE